MPSSWSPSSSTCISRWGPGGVFEFEVLQCRPGYLAARVSGRGARTAFQHESGGHRWQRVPPTEKRGRTHTSTVTVAVLREPSPGPWYYEQQELGYNYRITDLQCALGTSQLARLDAMVGRRRSIVAAYNEALGGLEHLVTPGLQRADDEGLISWHLYTVQIDFEALDKTRSQVMGELRERGIGTQVLYIPVHVQPYYRRTYGYAPGMCPVAEAYYTKALSLPLYPAMSDADVERVTRTVKEVIGA